jgi:hypothetical protein
MSEFCKKLAESGFEDQLFRVHFVGTFFKAIKRHANKELESLGRKWLWPDRSAIPLFAPRL